MAGAAADPVAEGDGRRHEVGRGDDARVADGVDDDHAVAERAQLELLEALVRPDRLALGHDRREVVVVVRHLAVHAVAVLVPAQEHPRIADHDGEADARRGLAGTGDRELVGLGEDLGTIKGGGKEI